MAIALLGLLCLLSLFMYYIGECLNARQRRAASLFHLPGLVIYYTFFTVLTLALSAVMIYGFLYFIGWVRQ